METAAQIPPDLAEATQLAQWITGKWISHAIYAAAKLSIADILQNGEKSVDELARETSTHAPSLYRLLRALASIGIFAESAPHRFQSTRLGALLCHGAMRSGCLMMHSEWHDRAWSHLLHSLRTGESGFEKAQGAPLFDWLSGQPEAAQIFNEAMTSGRSYRDYGVAETYNFGRFTRVFDVGGGQGSLMISILKTYPHLGGAIVDLPQTLEGAKRAIHEARLSSRCEVIEGDFFERVPEGGDVYVLAHVIHDWDDIRSQQILRNCRAAMSESARVLLIESLLSAGNQPERLKWLDLEMLVLTQGGRERTREQYRQLLESSGFEMLSVASTGGSRSIIEARIRSGS